MTVLLVALVIVAIPFLAVSALLKLSERLQDRRELERDRQIELTDAIHWELPLDRSVEVAALVGLVAKQFGADPTAERLEIVLKPATWNLRSVAVRSETSRQLPTDRPLAA